MKVITKCVVPILFLLFLTWIGHYLFYVDGEINWFIVMLVYGIPFGIPYMYIVMPVGRDSSAALAGLVISVLIGAFFGCIIAAVVFVKAMVGLVYYPVKWLVGRR